MRARKGHARRRARKRLFKDVKGAYLRRGNTAKLAFETLVRARQFAFRDRRAKKRSFRALWITRVTAACKMRGIRYSQFINGLLRCQIELNRKSLSELAIFHPSAFDELVKLSQNALQSA